jgi:excisionase family DNA binding protein
MGTTGPDLMTCEEAAAYLRVHERTVGRLLKRGELPGVKVGRQWRLRRADLDAYLRGERPAGNAETGGTETSTSGGRAAAD